MTENCDEQKIQRFIKIYPWYAGLSADLLFWIAIDSLFFTVVRNLSHAQLVSLTSVSVIGGILLQAPVLFVIKKAGNTAAVRIGTALLLISSLFMAFGNNYYLIAVGKVLYEVAFTFKNMNSAMLENNLTLVGKSDEFIKYRTKANTIYAVVTMLISFVAGFMFNINSFLPVMSASFFCAVTFALSFFMRDYSEKGGKTARAGKTKKNDGEKIHYTKTIILILLSFGLFYPIANSGQSNGKLLIQDVLLENTGVDATSLILSGVLAFSRIIRVISNATFYKIHIRFKNKVGVALAMLLSLSTLFFIIGYYLPAPLAVKVSVMSLGYLVILFIRDPFKVYAENILLKAVTIDKQQTMLTALDFFRKVVRALISISFAALLTVNPLILVIIILFALSAVEIIISFLLYKNAFPKP